MREKYFSSCKICNKNNKTCKFYIFKLKYDLRINPKKLNNKNKRRREKA